MDPPNSTLRRADSVSSAQSQTAQDFIQQHLQLEADAREALPYQFDVCTSNLGPIRQSVFACLTCNPAPASEYQQFTPAGVCYSCSISCHGEHELVEIFTKRDFQCDCGTTRFGNSGTPCMLQVLEETGQRPPSGISGKSPREGNKYNHNFKGIFCGCKDTYDPETEKGTMFQCLGLGDVNTGGCGEDWWHPECLIGLPHVKLKQTKPDLDGVLETVKEEPENNEITHTVVEDEAPLPEGFPAEDDFESVLCYKCVTAYPWVKNYAGVESFAIAIPNDGTRATFKSAQTIAAYNSMAEPTDGSKKRKAEDELVEVPDTKRAKEDGENEEQDANDIGAQTQSNITHELLPESPQTSVSLFLKEGFRERFCRCAECFPRLAKHPQLLEEEEIYEPPVSESGDENGNGSIAGRSVHSGSLLDRGEAALSSMDRVRAIEGVMAYNHVRDKVKAFLQPFAESGKAVGAEDIKAYFAQLRGDEQAMKDAAVGANRNSEVDNRKEQGGY